MKSYTQAAQCILRKFILLKMSSMIKKIKNAPGWLGLSEDRTEFIYLPDRAEIVEYIFQLSIGGAIQSQNF